VSGVRWHMLHDHCRLRRCADHDHLLLLLLLRLLWWWCCDVVWSSVSRLRWISSRWLSVSVRWCVRRRCASRWILSWLWMLWLWLWLVMLWSRRWILCRCWSRTWSMIWRGSCICGGIRG